MSKQTYTYTTARKSMQAETGTMTDAQVIAALEMYDGETLYVDRTGYRTVFVCQFGYLREVDNYPIREG